MQGMIKQIVDMDRQAREITDAAQLEKVNTERDIAEKRERIREDYLQRARHRLTMNEPAERAAAEKEWLLVSAHNKELLQALNNLYTQKGDAWVSSLVARVTGA